MKKMRIVSGLAAGLVAMSLLSACGGTPAAPASKPFVASRNSLTIEGKKVDFPWVLDIGGQKVDFDEYRYYYLTNKNTAEAMLGGDWESEEGKANAKDLVKATIDNIKAGMALAKMGADNKLTLSAEDKKSIEDKIVKMRASYPDDASFAADLEISYMTDNLLRKLMGQGIMADKLFAALFGPDSKYGLSTADLVKTANDNFVRAQHILIPLKADNAEALAKEVLAKATAKDADFAALVKQYSQDPGQPAEGYTFRKGEMVPEFEQAAFALKEGQVSGIVKTTYGYHIIKRMALSEETVKKEFSRYLPAGKAEEFYKMIDNEMDKMEVKYAPQFEAITPAAMAATIVQPAPASKPAPPPAPPSLAASAAASAAVSKTPSAPSK